MALSKATLVKRIRRELDDEPWESTLTVAYTAASGTATVASPTNLAEGGIMEFADGTQLRLTATPSANPISVKGGHNDTTDTNESNGAVFLYNPEYAFHEIEEAVERVIEELWPWVWFVDTENLTAVSGKNFYEVLSTFRGWISLVQDITPAATTKFRELRYGQKGSGYPVQVKRGLPSTIATTGLALYIPNVRTSPTTTIKHTFARTILTTVSAGSYSDLEDGLVAAMMVRGACAELLEDRETERVADDVEQGDIGVNPGQRLRNAAWHRERFERLRERVNLRLLEENPIMEEWAR